MSVLVTNNAVGELLVGISATETALLLAVGQGARFPAPLPGQDWFYVTAQDEAGELEVMKCTSRDADTLYVVRDVSHTGAKAFKAGSAIELRASAELFNDKADAKEFKEYKTSNAQTHATTKETLTALTEQLNNTISTFDNAIKKLTADLQTLSNTLDATKTDLSNYKTSVASTYMPTNTANSTFVKRGGDTITGSLTVQGTVKTPTVKTSTVTAASVRSGVAY